MYSNNRWRILTCFANALTELLLCRLFVCVISPVVQFTSEHYKQHSQSLWMANVGHTMFTLSPIGQRSTVMSMSVCLCTCLSVCKNVFRTIGPIFTKFFVHVTYGHALVLLWQHSDTLYTSGFVDDVIFAYKPSLLDVATQLKHSAHAGSLGLGYKLCAVMPVAGQRTHGTTFQAPRVTYQVVTVGAESMTALLEKC